MHISNMLKKNELDENSVIKNYLTTALDSNKEMYCRIVKSKKTKAKNKSLNLNRDANSAILKLN